VGQLKFRGTSLLLRAPISPVGRQQQPSQQQQQQPSKDKDILPEVTPAKKYKADDSDDVEEDEGMEYENSPQELQNSGADVAKNIAQPELEAYGYSIATHFVQVRSSGLLSDVKSLWQLADTDAVSKSVKTLLEHSKPGFQRFSSIHAFDKVNIISYTRVMIFTCDI